MAIDSPLCALALGPATVVATLSLWALAGNGAAMAPPHCSAFHSQAEAQESFAGFGGTPSHGIGQLDGDRDGVACEGLPAPYEPYATIGYNRKGGFLYGVATMPPRQGGEGFPCLRGNRKGPEGPRRLKVLRVKPGPDRPVLRGLGAEAKPESGRLVWKAEKDVLAPGRYYAAFTASIPLTPYGPNECPGFETRKISLP